MKRVIILGRGAAGKSTLAHTLSARLGIQHISLDALFWQPDLSPCTPDTWCTIQNSLLEKDTWIIDGDLGSHDTYLDMRIAAADTIIVLDYPFGICAWRTIRRGKENSEYWRWLLSYRFKHLPRIRRLIKEHASTTPVHYVRSPRGLPDLLDSTAVLSK